MFVTALPLLVGCDGLPAPAQYDHAMLREYFGKSPAELENAFGKPSSVTEADLQSPPEDATAEEQGKFNQATVRMPHTYSTVDGELVFHFNLNEKVFAITYVGKTVSPPDPPIPNTDKSAAPAVSATAFLLDMAGARHRLPQAEADFLAGLTAVKPAADSTDHIGLDPPYRVIVEQVDFALEADELILMHRGGTKHWNSSGVRARVLAAAGIPVESN